MASDKAPWVDAALVQYLDKLYPDCAPDPDGRLRDIWMALGRVQVVRKLKRMLVEQAEG